MPSENRPGGDWRSFVLRLGLVQTLFIVSALLLVALGLFARASLDGAAWRSHDERRERVALATIHAQRVDVHLGALLSQLATVADDLGLDGKAASVLPQQMDGARRSLFDREAPVESLSLVGPDGIVLLTSTHDFGLASSLLGSRLAVSPQLAGGRAEIAPVEHDGQAGHVQVSVPVADSSGTLRAILSAHADLSKMDSLLVPGSLGRTGSVSIVDNSGREIAGDLAFESRRVLDLEALQRLAQRGSPVIGSVQSWAPSSDEPRSRADLVALAPVTRAPLFAVVRQAEDEVFAEARDLERQLLLLFGFVAIVLIFAGWILWINVLHPVAALTATCQQMAAGEPDVKLPLVAGGEIGRLARAFQTMRSKLQLAHDEIATWNRQLEVKVAARTRQLVKLHDILLVEQQQVRLLLARLTNSQEDERKRIALGIHDSIIQPMLGAGYRIQAVQARVKSNPALAGDLRAAAEILAETVRDLRGIVSDLRPRALDVAGLVSAIELHLERFESQRLFVCHMRSSGIPVALTNAAEIGVYRIVQEALNNVQRHAEARAATVSLRFGRRSLALRVRDDGRGFDPASVCTAGEGGDHLGIRGMQERATMMGGKLKIKSRPGQGTVVLLVMPLHRTRDPQREG